MRVSRIAYVLTILVLVGTACSSDEENTATDDHDGHRSTEGVTSSSGPPPPSTTTTPKSEVRQIAGMDPVPDAANVYSETAAGKLTSAAVDAKPLVYVPDNEDGQVWIIDQATYEVVGKYTVGELVQHVVPSHDMKTLYATASSSNELIPFDPVTGKPGAHIKVDAPYNLYFSPDGGSAVVMAERRNRIDWYDPNTWQRIRSIDVPCSGTANGTTGGINHADWSADGSYFLATCEFSARMIKVDTLSGAVLGTLDLTKGDMPQDCRVGPNGTTFYVADMMAGGVHVIDGPSFTKMGFIATGDGAHGVYPSRDATVAYVSNRGHSGSKKPGGGTVSVIDFATNTVVQTWTIPGGGSPDMGGVSADGSKLWLSGRYDDVVYVFDTVTGEMIKKIPVGKGPHGLSVFPQPGRYSLGHTGNYR